MELSAIKRTLEQRQGGWERAVGSREGHVVVYRVVREDLSDKVTFWGRDLNEADNLGEQHSRLRTLSTKALRQETAQFVWEQRGRNLMICFREPTQNELKEEERTLRWDKRSNGGWGQTVYSFTRPVQELEVLFSVTRRGHWEVLSRGLTWSWHWLWKDPSGTYGGGG